MKITYSQGFRKEIVALHCPKCGERVKSVGLDPEKCKIEGLSCVCKRCGYILLVSAESEKTK